MNTRQFYELFFLKDIEFLDRRLGLKCSGFLDRLDKTSDPDKEKERELKILSRQKLFLRLISFSIVTIALYYPIPSGSLWWWLFWVPVLAFTCCKYLLRYWVSWDGFKPRKLTYGFFCCGNCRREKLTRQLFEQRLNGYGSVCKTCGSKVSELQERFSNIKSEIGNLGSTIKDLRERDSRRS